MRPGGSFCEPLRPDITCMPHRPSSPLLVPGWSCHRAESDVTSRLKPREGLVLYYPGAGTDYGLQHFALNLDLAVVVYVDYLIKPAQIRSMLPVKR